MVLRILILSVVITISSANLFITWICLELNLFSFVPLLLNKISSSEREASINYFLAQTLGSTTFLLFSIILFHASWLIKLNITLLIFVIVLKIGAAPCHYWYPSTIRIIRWVNCFILSTWQKLAPIFILAHIICFNMKFSNLEIIVSLNALTGGLIGIRQTLLKKYTLFFNYPYSMNIKRINH